MEGNVVSAARTLGICLIIAALIVVIGIHYSAEANCKRLGSAMQQAGANARTHTAFPSNITLNHRSSGPFQVDLSPNGRALNLEPVKVELTTKIQ